MNAAIGVSTDSAGNVELNKVFFPAGTSNVITSYGGFSASVWIKPFNWLKFQAGYFADTTLSGKIPFSPYWFHYYVTDILSNNDVFYAFGADEQNFTMSLTPMEGLFIAASLPVDYIAFMTPEADTPSAADSWKKIQAGAGYEIKDFGHIRAQYRGEAGSYTTNNLDETTTITQENGAIEVAFAFTKIEKLIIDIGAKIPLSDNAKRNVKGDFGIGAAISYGIGPLSINSLLYFGSGYDIDGVKADKSFTINPWITYKINDSWNVGVDANIYTKNGVVVLGADSTKNGASFAVFVERPLGFLSNCKISFAYDTVAERFSIPVMLNVMF